MRRVRVGRGAGHVCAGALVGAVMAVGALALGGAEAARAQSSQQPAQKKGAKAPDTKAPGAKPGDAKGGASAQDAVRALGVAEAAKDEAGVVAALRALWLADGKQAREACAVMMKKGTPSMRALCVASLARDGDVESIVAVARMAEMSRMAPEKRVLVRSLGGKDPEKAGEAARAFLKDGDPMVHAAAIGALGRLRDMGLARDLAVAMRPRPNKDTARDVEFILAMQEQGAARAITGMDIRDAAGMKRWVESGARPTNGDMGAAPPDGRRPIGKDPDAHGVMFTRNFDVTLRMKDWQQKVKESGVKSWGEFAQGLEDSWGTAMRGVTRVLGASNLPVIELALADEGTVAAEGSSTHYTGVFFGSSLVQKFMSWEDARRFIAEDTVGATMITRWKRPAYWAYIGMDRSLVHSQAQSLYAGGKAKDIDEEFRKHLAQGAVTEVVQWESPAVGDAVKYALGHAVVDYLRFGGFPESDVRLQILMERLGEKDHSKRAVEELWGKAAKELDQGMREWVEGKRK